MSDKIANGVFPINFLARFFPVFLFAALCAGFAFPLCAAQSAAPLAETRNVLILHSYHRGFSWTDSQAKGVEEVLGRSGMRLRVYTEYMDSKRNFGADWFEVLRRLYARKYAATRFDVVISTDDNAYWFLLRYQPELFPGCPVVFCGVNSYDAADLEGRPLFTGLPEIVDVQATLETALRLHPDIEIVHVLVDRTPTGNSTRKNLVKKVEPSFAGRLRFRYLDDLPMERVLQEVKRIGRRGILLLLNYNRDGLGRVYSHHEAIDLLAAATGAPIYGQWDFHLGRGIVGGKLASGREQGETAAQMAVRILRGESPESIPVAEEGRSTFYFDYRQLKRFGIDPAVLPEGSVLANAPKSFYEVNKRLIWILAGLLVFLTLALAGLSLHVMQRRRAERALQRVNQALLTLSSSNQRLIRAVGEEELLEGVCRDVVENGGFGLCWVGYVDSGTGHVSPQAHWEAGAGSGGAIGWCAAFYEGSPAQKAASSGKYCAVGDMSHHAQPLWEKQARSRGYAAAVALPLRSAGTTFGVLCILSRRADDFDEEKVGLLTTLADNLAYGVVAQRSALERRNAVDALRRSKDQLAVLLASLPIVPFTCAGGDPLRITYVGDAVREITGYPAAGFMQSAGFWSDRVHPEDLPGALDALALPWSGNIMQHRYRFRIADGSYRWFSDTRRLVGREGDGDLRITATWQDVTEDQRLRDEAEFRRRQVIQADKLASLGEVVAGVAHEINNPNAFIGYNIPLLRETWDTFRPIVGEYAARTPEWSRDGLTLDDYARDMDGIIEDIAAGASRITGVVSSLKEFARGGGPGESVPVDMNEVVRKAMLIVGAQVRSKFPSHVLRLGEGIPSFAGRPLELEQVVANLLVNATHAVGARAGALQVRTRFLERVGCVCLSVLDNGCGMAPQVLDQVFKPFFTTRRESGGTGLGLSVSYLLVEEHGGAFCVLSRPGEGTRFSVLLPVEGAPEVALRPTVVCVGADVSMERLLEAEVAGLGWSVEAVHSLDGAEAMLADRPEVFAVVVDARTRSDESWLKFREGNSLLAAVAVGPYAASWPGMDAALPSLDGSGAVATVIKQISQVIL